MAEGKEGGYTPPDKAEDIDRGEELTMVSNGLHLVMGSSLSPTTGGAERRVGETFLVKFAPDARLKGISEVIGVVTEIGEDGSWVYELDEKAPENQVAIELHRTE